MPDQRWLESLTVQQGALLTFMQHRSEENWCAAWYSDLEYALLDARTRDRIRQPTGGSSSRRLAGSPGTGLKGEVFVPGAPGGLEDAAVAHRKQSGRR